MTTDATLRDERSRGVDVNEITYGVEIECYVPSGSVTSGGYHRGRQVAGLASGWNAQHDSSLGRAPRGYEGVEIVSPILRGAEGLRQINQAIGWLQGLDARVNTTCGLHVHVGFPNDRREITKLLHLVANFETAIYASTGTKSRETSHWSAPITDSHRELAFGASDLSGMGHAVRDRYHSLNLTNLIYGSKPTVEFRAFAGTLNYQKIVGHVRLCVGLVERTLTRTRRTGWDAKTPVATSPIHRNGEGATCLTRLFYQLGWTKGRVAHTFGNLTGDDLPTIKRSKQALMKMARKYDQS